MHTTYFIWWSCMEPKDEKVLTPRILFLQKQRRLKRTNGYFHRNDSSVPERTQEYLSYWLNQDKRSGKTQHRWYQLLCFNKISVWHWICILALSLEADCLHHSASDCTYSTQSPETYKTHLSPGPPLSWLPDQLLYAHGWRTAVYVACICPATSTSFVQEGSARWNCSHLPQLSHVVPPLGTSGRIPQQ